MKIELNIKKPNDNTNEYHGSINIKMDRRYAYIKHDSQNIVVDSGELYRAINALYQLKENTD